MSHVRMYVHMTLFLSIDAHSFLTTYLKALLVGTLKCIPFLFILTLVFIARVNAPFSPMSAVLHTQTFQCIQLYLPSLTVSYFSLCPSPDTSYLIATLSFLNYKPNFFIISRRYPFVTLVVFVFFFFLFFCSFGFFNHHCVLLLLLLSVQLSLMCIQAAQICVRLVVNLVVPNSS